MYKQILPKLKQTRGIESYNFNEFNKPMDESYSNFNLILFWKGLSHRLSWAWAKSDLKILITL